jgi:two-component system sensor histidine kinase CpxA
MNCRFPLYAKILLWFFLNLLLLAVAFGVFLSVQFHFGLDSLLAGRAGDRLRAVSEVITRELHQRPRAEWDDVLSRFSEAYGIRFVLFRPDSLQMAGETLALPPEVRARLAELVPRDRLPGTPGLRPLPGLGNPPAAGPPGAWRDRRPDNRQRLPAAAAQAGDPADGNPPPPLARLPRPEPRTVVHTFGPNRYWVIIRTFVPEANRLPQPTALLAVSETLSAGGLFFDPLPWVLAGCGVILFSVLFWIPLVRGITRRVAQITRATARIAEGRFDVRVDAGRSDELGLLGTGINRMAGRIESLVSGQKRFLGDIAHELCSPLARLRVALGILEERADPASRTYVTIASDKAAQMASLVNELLSFSKAALGTAPINFLPVNVRAVAAHALQRETAEDVTLRNEVPESVAVLAEPELLTRALANLLRNAVRYAGQAGPITVTAVPSGGEVEIIVSDHGPGIPEADLVKVFDPFYRLDTSRDRTTGGAGLGLAIVRTCVESCGGTVSARNRQPAGLDVVIRLPLAPPAGPEL